MTKPKHPSRLVANEVSTTKQRISADRARHDLVTVRAALQTGFSLLLTGSDHRARAEALIDRALERMGDIIERMSHGQSAGEGEAP